MQRSHSKPAVYRIYKNLDIPLQCDNIKHVFKHLTEHLEVGTTILCPFNNCKSSFTKKSSFTSHFSRYHKSDTVDQVPAELIQIQNEFEEPEYDTDDYATFHPDSFDAIEVLEET